MRASTLERVDLVACCGAFCLMQGAAGRTVLPVTMLPGC